MLPPFNGGLHCGEPDRRVFTPLNIMLPPHSGGLYCSARLEPTVDRSPNTCSCCLAAGSVAVRTSTRVTSIGVSWSRCQQRAPLRPDLRALSGCLQHLCSRRSATGSIAVAITTSGAPRPRLSAPPCSGGLHSGIRHAPDGRRAQYVLPPSDGGLHCGNDKLTVKDRHAYVLPPFNGGLHLRPAGHVRLNLGLTDSYVLTVRCEL